MHATLQFGKKRVRRAEVRAASAVHTTSPLLFIVDRNSKLHFLIDTGADISVVPAKFKSLNCAGSNSANACFNLQSADGSKIAVLGQKLLNLNLGLRRDFQWTFLVANVTDAILGADFIHHYGLLVDVKNQKLIDSLTSLEVSCRVKTAHQPGIRAIFDGIPDPYRTLLRRFPNLLRPTPATTVTQVKHAVTHHIETKGPPSHCRPRRLPPDKYQAARQEFQQMLEMGIVKPSSSPWASPLHMVTKRDDTWRPCGD